MKFVIDDKIPFIKGVLEPFAEVVYLPGGKISAADVSDADALVVRTRTCCNEALLKGSSVRFVATATIGFDHIDTKYCEDNGVFWTNAAGCNAQSVAQYVASALCLLRKRGVLDFEGKTIGVVGVGNVGRRVRLVAEALGMKVLLNDPPRELAEGLGEFVSLDEICEKADVITFHTPLSLSGEFKTFHLADASFYDRLKKCPVIINAARGEVLDSLATLAAIKDGKVSAAVIDCWENEPDVNKDLLMSVAIATPHVAGYSADGKANATSMSVRALSRFFGLGIDDFKVTNVPLPENVRLDLGRMDDKVAEAVLASYDIGLDDASLRADAGQFERLRGDYPLRREFDSFVVSEKNRELERLGFNVAENC